MRIDVKNKRGKVFGLHPKIAKVLVSKGKLQYADEQEAVKAAVPAETKISRRTGRPVRQYLRRDLQAEHE